MAITYLSGQRVQGSSTGVASFTPAGSFNVRYIVCGGGAGSGTNNGGGGGAGAFITNASYGVTAQTYSIIVGEKSVGKVGSTVVANGGDSTFGDIVAGGGGAGGNQSIDSGNGQDATSGSGGGGTESGNGGSSGSYGYDGGNGGAGSPAHGSGGGGGSSAVGANSTSSSGGNGGAGTDSDITGSTINYCAGGGGSTQSGSVGQGGNSSAGDGAGTGNGVGGNATTTAVGTSAGNGGGGGRGSTYKGGDGSDGIIILRFTTSGNSYSVVGGQVDIDGSDTVITFTVGNAGAQDEKTTVTNVPVGSQFEETDTRRFYQFGGTVAQTVMQSTGNEYGSVNSGDGWGVEFGGSSSHLGKFINKFTLYFASSDPSQSIALSARIYDDSDNLVATSSNTINNNTLATYASGNYIACQWTFTTGRTLVAGDKLAIYAPAINLRGNQQSGVNGNEGIVEYSSGSWGSMGGSMPKSSFTTGLKWTERGTAI